MPVPQELIDIIVDNLHDDTSHAPSLRSCALTARAFVRSAQIHIFQRVEIKPPRDRIVPSPTPCQKLYDLLVSSPHIAPLVTNLSIVLAEPGSAYEREQQKVPWVMTGRTLALILPLLNLKRISLVENPPANWNLQGKRCMSWNQLPRQLKSALTDVFSSPRLEAVHLRGIIVESPYQLLALFSEASALKELSLSRVYFTSRETQLAAWPDSRPWRPLLTSLLISDESSPPFVRYLISPRINLAAIRSLTLSTHAVESRDTIISTANGVEHLRFRNLRPFISDPLRSAFAAANLRSIHFYTAGMFELLGTFFKVCPRNTGIEIITLEGPGESTEGVVEGLDSPVVHLHSLKMVEIKTVLYSSLSTWAADVRSLLPSLEARRMLTFTSISVAKFKLEARHGWE
ncbi:hypothetical protein C8R46DRAFT_1329365 [Mycena filopes]|nr:hypothetical protein C8R46DRAFT_1329365 [Mycena filopes]